MLSGRPRCCRRGTSPSRTAQPPLPSASRSSTRSALARRTSKSTAVRPQASLSVVEEIKLLVGEACYAQDQELACTEGESLERCMEMVPSAQHKLDCLFVDRALHRQHQWTVVQLSQVSREWHRLCAPLRFRIMTDVDLRRRAFADCIQPSYGPLVKELCLNIVHFCKVKLVERIDTQLPGPFDIVAIPWWKDLMQDGWCEPERIARMSRALRSILNRTTKIHIAGPCRHFLEEWCHGTGIREDVCDIVQVVQHCASLLTLSVCFEAGWEDIPELPPVAKVQPTALKRMSMTVLRFTDFPHPFLALFASTVEDLHLTLQGNRTLSESAAKARTFTSSTPFPRLRRLELEGFPDCIVEILRGASILALPSLARISVSAIISEGSCAKKLEADLQSILDRFATTATAPLDVSLCCEDMDTGIAAPFPSVLAAPPIRIVPFALRPKRHSYPNEVFTHPDRAIEADSADLEAAEQALFDSLNVMQNQVRTARIMGDRTQLAQLAGILQGWERNRYNLQL